jgi:hypothetical protein
MPKGLQAESVGRDGRALPLGCGLYFSDAMAAVVRLAVAQCLAGCCRGYISLIPFSFGQLSSMPSSASQPACRYVLLCEGTCECREYR